MEQSEQAADAAAANDTEIKLKPPPQILPIYKYLYAN